MRNRGYTDSSPQAGSRHRVFHRSLAAIKSRRLVLNSLEFAEPGVGNDGSQHWREVAEAAEGMVDGGREVLVPFQVGEEVKRQHRWGDSDRGRFKKVSKLAQEYTDEKKCEDKDSSDDVQLI